MQCSKIFIKPVNLTISHQDKSYNIFGYFPNGNTVFLKVLTKNVYKIVFDKKISNKDLEFFNKFHEVEILSYSKNIAIIYTNELIAKSDHIIDVMNISVDSDMFLTINNIELYEWIEVNEFYEIITIFTKCDYNLCCTSIVISQAKISHNIIEKCIYWSVNTLIDDSTKMQSMLNVKNYNKRIIYAINMMIYSEFNIESYIITNQVIDVQKIGNINYIYLKSEQGIIQWFFNIISIVLPDFLISFNCNDIIANRMIELNIKQTIDFKVLGQSLMIENIESSIDHNNILKFNSFKISGINNIDLYFWANKYIPHLFENISYESLRYYKDIFNDLISNKYFFIDNKFIKKSNYKIDNKILKSDNKLKILSLIQENYEILRKTTTYCLNINLIDNLKLSCNKLKITIDSCLSRSVVSLTERYFNRYSPFIIKKLDFTKKTSKIFKKCKSNVYLNCHMYLLKNIYDIEDNLLLAPPLMIITAYNSGYVKRSNKFKKILNNLRDLKNVIYINSYYLISLDELNSECSKNLEYTKQIVTFRS